MNTKRVQSEAQYEAIVIGVSAGGFEALSKLFSSLPESLFFSIIVVQHVHHTADDFFVEHMNSQSKLLVKEAEEKETILPQTIYIAPAGYHLLIEEDKTFSLSVDSPVNYARPSVDVLFESAADVYRDKLIGIILTGANKDGSQGLKKIKERGGLTIVQDPKTAQFDAMPKAAISLHTVDHVLTLEGIQDFFLDV